MGVVYLAYCGSWQLSLHVPCFCAFYIFNTTPNPTSSSFFQNVFVLVLLVPTPSLSSNAIFSDPAGSVHINASLDTLQVQVNSVPGHTSVASSHVNDTASDL